MVFVCFLSACGASNQTQTGQARHSGQWFLSKVEFEKLNSQNKEVDWPSILSSAQFECEKVAIDAPIKKPRCGLVTPVLNCQPISRTVGGDFCSKPLSNKSCPIQEVQAYRQKLKDEFHGCMAQRGWEFQPFGDRPQPLQPVIDSIPELVEWQRSDWEKWKLVAKIDAELASAPEYKDLPVRERLLVVVKKVKAATAD